MGSKTQTGYDYDGTRERFVRVKETGIEAGAAAGFDGGDGLGNAALVCGALQFDDPGGFAVERDDADVVLCAK